MEILIICALLVIAAETTYLVVAQTIKFKHSKKQHMPIFVDTSVLIDGRITSIAESGFITSTLFVPQSVVGELQFLADNADTEKRSRARHGLDIVKELQAMPHVKVEIFHDGMKAEEGVDNRLLKLAKQYNGAICTIDFNLNKVAQTEGIPVLNVNDLAKTLRMSYLPGEKVKLELIQKGNDGHQAIGHLDDGTMVVVEHASSQIGKVVEIEFIRGLQTAAGKMMFARLVGGGDRDLAKKATQSTKSALAKIKLPRQKPERVERVKPVPSQSPQKAPVAIFVPEIAVQAPRPSRPQQPRYNKPTAQENSDKPSQPPRTNNGRQNNRRRTPEDSLFELLDRQD